MTPSGAHDFTGRTEVSIALWLIDKPALGINLVPVAGTLLSINQYCQMGPNPSLLAAKQIGDSAVASIGNNGP